MGEQAVYVYGCVYVFMSMYVFWVCVSLWACVYTSVCVYMYVDGSGRGHGNPLQFSCLENPMDRGACQATVHRVAKSQT